MYHRATGGESGGCAPAFATTDQREDDWTPVSWSDSLSMKYERSPHKYHDMKNTLIRRPDLEFQVERGLKESQVVSILGPRQCGKTTLARAIATRHSAHIFDLERETDRRRLEDPQRAFSRLAGLVVIDEVQRMPALFEVLRVEADMVPLRRRFLILGSATPFLLKMTSESLAGRVRSVRMTGFMIDETGGKRMGPLWLRGGFPRSLLAGSDEDSLIWREEFIAAFLERDLPQLEVSIPAATLRRFWTMLAHNHGQTWNGSEIGGSLGFAHTTVRRYLDLLTDTFMVRQLPPWTLHAVKRVVRSPKVYVRDTGLLHALLRIESVTDLDSHPKRGASWEGFALEHVLRRVGDRHASFWATHNGAELDLVIQGKGGRRYGCEFKSQESPAVTKSMHIAMEDLRLERLWVVHPGPDFYPLAASIEAVPLADMDRELAGAGLWNKPGSARQRSR